MGLRRHKPSDPHYRRGDHFGYLAQQRLHQRLDPEGTEVGNTGRDALNTELCFYHYLFALDFLEEINILSK